MKRSFIILIPVLLLSIFILDYSAKRRDFNRKKTELEASVGFDQVETMINTYFFDHGWYPDSLQEVDSVFSQISLPASVDSLIETSYRFLIDPFSGRFFKYIPTYNGHTKADGFYLISAGIDSSYNNTSSDKTLKLYDSLSFSYYDLYLGAKDILISKRTIEEYTSHKGFNLSLEALARRYPLAGRKRPPRFVEFSGEITAVYSDHFRVVGQSRSLFAKCHLARSSISKFPAVGSQICVRGIFKKIETTPDTMITFLNCIILSSAACEPHSSN